MTRSGFEYTPRERSKEGRMFEHAADSRILVDHLSQISDQSTAKSLQGSFYIKVANEAPADPKNEKEEQEVEATFIEQRDLLDAQTNLGVEESQVLMTLNKAYIDLSMKANGKADLYFHSYFMEKYLLSLTESQQKLEGTDPASGIDILNPAKHQFMKRILGLSQTLSKVIINIKKFPFHEKMYRKYVTEFGMRQTQKKMKYLEEIQRALFVA